MSDCDCLPPAGDLLQLAKAARDGHLGIPYVGSGDLDTVIGCGHGLVRLGDLSEAPAGCTEPTKAGEPCKGTPGPDGLCAAHKKAKEATSAGPVPPPVDTDPPA